MKPLSSAAEPLGRLVDHPGELERLSDDALIEYVDEQLARGLPQGWTCCRKTRARRWDQPVTGALNELEWKIQKDGWDAYQDYRVEVSREASEIIILHGNNTGGVLEPRHLTSTRSVVPFAMLELFGSFSLSDIIADVIERLEPNWWSPT